MSDKPRIVAAHPPDPTYDELRAEVERLTGFVAEMQPELGKLKTENERLVMQHENLSRECLGQYELMSAEVERLREERDNAIDAEKIALREIGAEVERLRADNRGLSETIGEWQEIHGTFVANPEVERLRADIKDHEAREQLMFEVARRLFGEDEAKRWLTVVFEAYRELANHKEC